MTGRTTQARDVHAGDIIRIDGTAACVDSKRTVDLDGLVAIMWKRGTRSGVMVRAGRAPVTCLYRSAIASCCISCEMANNALSRGRHCGRCSCCRRTS